MSEVQHGEEAVPGLGYAFIQYTTVLEAASAARALRLKTFNDKQVQVDYYPLALYLKEVSVCIDVDVQDYGEIGELVQLCDIVIVCFEKGVSCLSSLNYKDGNSYSSLQNSTVFMSRTQTICFPVLGRTD